MATHVSVIIGGVRVLGFKKTLFMAGQEALSKLRSETRDARVVGAVCGDPT